MSSVYITQGDTVDANVVEWTFQRNGTAVDITGAVARLYIESEEGVEVLDVDTADSAGSRVRIITGTDGVITPDLNAATTAAFPVGLHFYDLTVTLSGQVTTIVRQGQFEVREDLAE